MVLNKEDYEEPRCPFDTSRWKREVPVNRIPLSRVIDKLDESYSKADYNGALRIADYWMQEAKAGNDLAGQFAIHNELMGTYRKMGNKEKAFENAKAAFDLIERMGITGSISEGTALVNAATVCSAFDMPEESYEYFKRAVPIYESQLQPGDWRLGGLYNNMAVTLNSLERYDEAIGLYDRAIAAMELVDGSEGEQAVSWLNLADTYALKYGNDRSEDRVSGCCRKAIELMDTPGLKDDVNYAFYCEKCAPVLEYYGFADAGKELLRRAEKAYGSER